MAPLTITEKIMKSHAVGKVPAPGEEICLKVDQTLFQDATGTMGCLQMEEMRMKKPKTKFSIIYVDHNMLQADNKNMEDHIFLQTFADSHGITFSKPGNGICHHIQTERFTKPGQILLGADSHTPTAASGGMLAIGAGGMHVAVAMMTGVYQVKRPEVLGVKLTGKLKPWVAPKDVILEVLRRIGVKGGVGKVLEYFGPGVKTLQAPERATIGNMGAETGATSTVFPSDANTKAFFKAQNRVKDWKPLTADRGAEYDEIIEIALDEVVPLIACPYSPGNVKAVADIQGLEAYQAMIGSSTNSSYKDLMVAAKYLEGKTAHKRLAFHVIPGSRQTLETLDRDGGLMSLIKAGARIAEPSCNACIGMGNAPASNTVSVRSFNRNWQGRSGTIKDEVYLSSPETALATAIKGEITDPRDLGKYPKIAWPTKYVIDDAMILKPTGKSAVIKGSNIKPFPTRGPLEDKHSSEVLLKVGNDISTDHIMPAGAGILPLRSNIEAISQHVFEYLDPSFPARALELKKHKIGGVIVGGENYGQGSSREHAAIAPMYLGVKAVLVKSLARIHKSNLINYAILPLEFTSKKDYNLFKQGTKISMTGIRKRLQRNENLMVSLGRKQVEMTYDLSTRERDIMLHGGMLNYVKKGLLRC